MKSLITLIFSALICHLQAQCPPLVLTGDEMTGPTEVCKNEITIYTASEVENATSYLFALSTGQYAETDIPELDIEWSESLPDTIYTLCISALNDCEMIIDYACLDIEFRHAVELNVELTLCPGEVYELGGNEYEAPGEYTYESFQQVGCDSLVFIVLEEHAPMNVDADVTNDDGSCNGAIDLTVLGSPPFSYEWSSGPGPNGFCEGTYTVTISDANGCTGVFDIEVGLETATGSLQKIKYLPLFPNPANTHQALSMQYGDHTIRSVEYINLQGQVIWKSAEVLVTNGRVMLPGIAVAGMYQVRMIDDVGDVFVGRVIVLQ